VEGVKSKEQQASQQSDSAKSGGGGLGGMLARKIAKKDAADASSARAMIFTAEHEVQEVQTTVAAADTDIPAGFKEKK
jgi:hypothetical protein